MLPFVRENRLALAVPLFAVAYGTNVSTPLLLLYKNELQLSTWTVTALFAIYPLGLAPALAYSGPASDVLGRKRILFPGLVLSGLASAVMLAGAHSTALLFTGRLLLGAVSGMVFVVASAWMQEISRDAPLWAARLTGLAVYGGFGLGPLFSGILGEWGPAPLATPYLVHVGLILVSLITLRDVPETVKPDPTRTIRPRLGIPVHSRRAFRSLVVPAALGVFGVASLGYGLFPVLLQPAMASIAVFVTGLMGGLSMASIVPVQALVGRIGPHRSAPPGLALGALGCLLGTLAFVTGAWPLLFPAAIAIGSGSGLSMTSGLRFVDLLCEPADRGAMTGAFYAVAYAGMTMPVLVASLAVGGNYTGLLIGLTVAAAVGAIWLHRVAPGFALDPLESKPDHRE